MKKLIIFCFYIPLILNILNVQTFIGKFVSTSLAQLLAYGTLSLVLIGGFALIWNKGRFTPLIKSWIIFYLAYYSFSLLANAVLQTDPPILKTLVPVCYFFGFSILLSKQEELKSISKILAIGFFASCLLLIYFQNINFSMDHDGVYKYQLERAGGVYGDANNAAVAAILSFLFINFSFKPSKGIHFVLKSLCLGLSIYSLILTFSKTGFLVFILILGLTYHKFFTKKRILFSIIFIPIILGIGINWALNTEELSTSQQERIEDLVNLLTFQSEKVSFSGRDVLLKNMLGFVNEHPFLGNGLNFGNEIRGHNTLIGVWADAGFITFLIFLILLGHYIKMALKQTAKVKYFSLAIIVTLYIYMLSLQTIINQGYIIVVFVYLGYLLYPKVQLDS